MENFFKTKNSQKFKQQVQISDYDAQYKSEEQIIKQMRLKLAQELVNNLEFIKLCPLTKTRLEGITQYKTKFKITEI